MSSWLKTSSNNLGFFYSISQFFLEDLIFQNLNLETKNFQQGKKVGLRLWFWFMDVYSWFRRSLSRTTTTTTTTVTAQPYFKEDELLYGVTDQLLDFIKSFSIDTFRNFSLPGSFFFFLFFWFSVLFNEIGYYIKDWYGHSSLELISIYWHFPYVEINIFSLHALVCYVWIL